MITAVSRSFTPIRRLHYLLLAAAGLLAVLAVLNIRVSAPPPAGAPLIRVRWAPPVADAEQAARESAFRLRRGDPHADRTWNYDLLDTSPANIEALVTDPAVEDTDGIDRRRFRIELPPVTIAERLTTAYPALERMAGRGLEKWLSVENAWPAVLAFAWLVALTRPSVRTAMFGGIPALSSRGLGLFRIALGVSLLASVPGVFALPEIPLPVELHREAGVFADWDWVHWLAAHPDVNSLVLMAALGALALFTAGIFPRATYAIALLALTGRALAILQFRSAHDIGLPLVALWGLVLVPWDAALTVMPSRRESAGDAGAHGWAVWWPGAVLGVGLLAAAYAKLDTSGLDWVLGGAVKYHFVEDFKSAPTSWGLWIATHPGWAVAASCGAVVTEALVILHVFFRHWLARMVAGLAVLALLGGLYVLQGPFWPLWWILLLAFVPWNSIARLRRPTEAPSPGGHPALRPQHVAFITALVSIQLFASARRVEIEPFVSDYGMYSWTWPSTDAFDRQISRKYQVYHYMATNAGDDVDVTDRLRALPKAIDTLANAVDRLRDGGDLPSSDRDALRKVVAMYESEFDAPVSSLRVLHDQEAFDWDRGRFYQKATREPIGIIDLSAGTFDEGRHGWQ
jgi:hypothetical protein